MGGALLFCVRAESGGLLAHLFGCQRQYAPVPIRFRVLLALSVVRVVLSPLPTPWGDFTAELTAAGHSVAAVSSPCMGSGRDRRWIIRLMWHAQGDFPAESMWYGGWAGARGPQVVNPRDEAHCFDRFRDAAVVKQNLLSLGVADEIEIEAR